jgi:predicted DNA-binding protein
MVAAGNIQAGEELDNLCELATRTLDYYLKNVGNTQQDLADYHMAQNLYCHYQKQNPHVIKSMVSMGVEESTMKRFVSEVLFPEIV